MKIEFVGGAKTVTGSSYIVKTDRYTVMVDCGMFQGTRELKERNSLKLIYAPEQIDALLLTHAHIDHSGLIPKLVKEGFTKSIFATEATAELCSVMLPDSAHIQEMDNEWINRRQRKLGREQLPPLYTVEDAEASIGRFVPVKYGAMVDVCPGVKARFRDAGHILGSSFIELWAEEKGKTCKIVFSGDLGARNQALIRDFETIDEADILLVESTYGDRLHKNRQDTYEEFKTIIKESYNKKGNIIIPSFAVERTQEIVFVLKKLLKEGAIPPIPVYIDSPLAIAATEIFKKYHNVMDQEAMAIFGTGENPFEFPGLKYVKTTEESIRLNKEAKGSIIISASGMCTAGRIKYHLQNNLYRPESSVIFVGFQAEGTLGRKLVDGDKRVSIYGEDVMVRAKIHTLGGFSAHADRDTLLEWMGTINNPRLKVFVVHGEEETAQHFAQSVRERFGCETHVPGWGEIVELETMSTSMAKYGRAAAPVPDVNIENEIAGLKKGVDALIESYRRAREEKRIYQARRIEQEISDLAEKARQIAREI